MPRYFFNVCSDEFEETDLIGKPCADDLEALGEALAKASSIVQQRLLAERFSNSGSIEVEDERSRRVLSLPLRSAAY